MMSLENALVHFGNFLMMPVFVGCIVGAVSKVIYFPSCSILQLMMVGFLGCLLGMICGWVFTGYDGHMLNYGAALVVCSFSVLIRGTISSYLKK